MQGDASTIRAVVEPPNDCLRRLFAHSAHTSRLCPIRALLQGTLDFIVLQTLRWEPQHGFGIGQMIRANSSDALQVDTGSLYPALHRLERAGLIDAKWDRSEKGQHVRVYRITASGRKRLAVERTKWDRMTQAIAGILNPPRERES